MQPSTMVAQVLRSADPDEWRGQQSSTSGASRLIAAVASGDLALLRTLLEADVSPDATYYGRTAVVWAVLHGQYDSLELLLEAGADPHTRTASGKTPMEIARSLNCRRSIALLAAASVRCARQRFRSSDDATRPGRACCATEPLPPTGR